jgi:hypothetical protein
MYFPSPRDTDLSVSMFSMQKLHRRVGSQLLQVVLCFAVITVTHAASLTPDGELHVASP